jgi:hypothetical protein
MPRTRLTGQSSMVAEGSLDACKSAFKKKFNEKTKNQWENRANFEKVSSSGLYFCFAMES